MSVSSRLLHLQITQNALPKIKMNSITVNYSSLICLHQEKKKKEKTSVYAELILNLFKL